jgi:hypothetical protein
MCLIRYSQKLGEVCFFSGTQKVDLVAPQNVGIPFGKSPDAVLLTIISLFIRLFSAFSTLL